MTCESYQAKLNSRIRGARFMPGAFGQEPAAARLALSAIKEESASKCYVVGTKEREAAIVSVSRVRNLPNLQRIQTA